MNGRRLPRDLRYAINSRAHEHAQLAGAIGYRRRYAEEKARLQALVVTWLAAGDTAEQALAKLYGGRRSAAVRETLKVLQKAIKDID